MNELYLAFSVIFKYKIKSIKYKKTENGEKEGRDVRKRRNVRRVPSGKCRDAAYDWDRFAKYVHLSRALDRFNFNRTRGWIQ